MKKIQLSIPKPCHENWNNMTTTEQGKFCASCQKAVIDFTNMSERQVAEFFKKPASSVCGRFYQDQLNKEIELPKKRIPWVKYFFQISLPAFLVSMKASAQKTKVVMGDTSYCTQTMGFVSTRIIPEKNIDTKTITGQIVDADGNRISFASVIIKNSNIGTQSDAGGRFQIKVPDKSILVFSAVGYRSKEIAVDDKTTNLLVTFEKNEVALSGEVVVGFTVRKKSRPIPLIKRVLDTAFKKFSVYPNPAQTNSTVKIDLMKLNAGKYTISIVNSSGEIIQTEERDVESKDKIVNVTLKDVAAGTYFVHLFNRKTAVSYSEQIIVQ